MHIFLNLTAIVFALLMFAMALDFQIVSRKIPQIKTNRDLFFYFWCMEIHPSKHKQNLCFAGSGRGGLLTG